jgi:small-conductance mechanosensitive channel
MLNSFSANVVSSYVPDVSYEIPYYGAMNLQTLSSAVLLFVTLVLFFWVMRSVILRKLTERVGNKKSAFPGLLVTTIHNIRWWFYCLIAFYASVQFFVLPNVVDVILDGVFYLALAWQSIEVTVRLVDFFINRKLEKRKELGEDVDPEDATTSHLIALIARIILWSIGILFVLSNMGVEITSLLAGLGIGGIAIAFALQGVLKDLFASFSIYLDKPFRIGDFIVVGLDSGNVEKIGIKSTRIKTLQGEQLVISNAELTNARVQNFKLMEERRVVTRIGVIYETAEDKLKLIPEIVREIFEPIAGSRLDRAHFASFGDFALIFEIVYFVESREYSDYMDIQQIFNLELKRRFEENNIQFAYPTQLQYTKVID